MKHLVGIVLALTLSLNSHAERYLDNTDLKQFCAFLFPLETQEREASLKSFSSYLRAVRGTLPDEKTREELINADAFAKRSSEHNELLRQCFRQCTTPTNPDPANAEAFEAQRIARNHGPSSDPLKYLLGPTSCLAKEGTLNSVLQKFFLNQEKIDKAFELYSFASWILEPSPPKNPDAAESSTPRNPAPVESEPPGPPPSPMAPQNPAPPTAWADELLLPHNPEFKTILFERPRKAH